MRALLLAATVALLSTQAQGRELTPHDLQLIEHINQRENQHAYPKDSDPCQNYAVVKAGALLLGGFTPDEVRLAVVRDDLSEGHEVTTVLGTIKGKPVELVLDNRWPWVTQREALEQYGYVWMAEAAPMPNQSPTPADAGLTGAIRSIGGR